MHSNRKLHHSSFAQVPSAPSKEKRKAQVLIKHLPPNYREGGPSTRILSADQSYTNRNPPVGKMFDDSPSKPAPAFTGNKENIALQTSTIGDASRQPRNRKVETQDQVKEPSKSLSIAGGKPHPTSSICKTNDNVGSTSAEGRPAHATTKVPIDPPGAILGALPFVQFMNGQQQLVASTVEHVGAGSLGGHHNHQIFHPLFPSMTNWGYHPSHHHQNHQGVTQQQQHHRHHHHGTLNNDNHNPSHQWVMPYFLAPYASTVCTPSANRKSNESDLDISRQSNGDASHPSNNAPNVQNTSLEHFVRNSTITSTEADDTISTDESMASTEEDANEAVKDEFIPSTFAPPECVEKIRARQKAADEKYNDTQPRQTRSMSRRQRRDNRSKSSKSKPMNSEGASTVAHQACSPRTNVAQVNGGGSKVAAVDAANNGKTSQAAEVMTVLGKRVTMIDPVRKVFIIDLLSPSVCDEIRMMADNHTREVHKSGLKTETWRTLYTYTKMDLPVAEVKDMTKRYTEQILLDVKKIVGEIFGGSMRKEAMNLRPRYEYLHPNPMSAANSFLQPLTISTPAA